MRLITLLRLTFIFISVALIFILVKTRDSDVTYKDTIETFHQYQTAANDFLRKPSEHKLSQLSQHQADFVYQYEVLINHQTQFNKLLKIPPILTEQEVLYIKELKSNEQKLDEQVLRTTWKEIYKASDFSTLIEDGKRNGKYQSETIDIVYNSKRDLYEIRIDGDFRDGESHKFLRSYFLIETERGNYYWEKPINYSILWEDKKAELSRGRTKYIIKGNIRNE